MSEEVVVESIIMECRVTRDDGVILAQFAAADPGELRTAAVAAEEQAVAAVDAGFGFRWEIRAPDCDEWYETRRVRPRHVRAEIGRSRRKVLGEKLVAWLGRAAG